MSEKSYKIISAVKDGDRLVVEAAFYDGDKEVSRSKQAFPIGLSENEIEEAIKQSCQTFFGDLESAREEKLKEEESQATQEKIDNLIGKQSEI